MSTAVKKLRPRQSADAELKHCYGCGRTLPNTLEFFYGLAGGRASLFYQCRECHSVRNRNYYEATSEERLAHGRKIYDRDREALNVRKRERYRTDPQVRAKKKVNWTNRNARLRGAGGTHTVKDIEAINAKQSGRCFYCDTELSEHNSEVDHVEPIVAGGSNGPENLVLACFDCNRRKGASDLNGFITRMRLLIANGGDNKLRERMFLGVCGDY